MARKPRYPRAFGTQPAKAQSRAALGAIALTDEILGGFIIDDRNNNQLIRKDA